MVTSRIRRVAGTLFVLGAVSFASDRATMQTPGAMQLTAIEVSGSRRISKDDVVKLSGLKIGEAITPAALETAANRLNSTGLFRSVQYRYTTASGKLDAILQLEDEAWTLPVVFDNFVWFQDSEILAAVTRDVPTFNGTLPANEQASQYVAGVLTRLLASRQLQGRVMASPRINTRNGSKQLLFRVVDTPASLKMCALRVPGASAVPEAELQQAAQSALGGDYSRAFVTDLANGTLRQVYRRRGYWEATVAPASAVLDAGCAGVTVTFQVQEGAQYVYDHAEWTGTAALASPDLDRAINMKAGGVAGLNELEAGLRGVHGAYEKSGYIMEQAEYEPSLDDATHHATFKITVAEHQQFHMGTIAIAGGAAADDAAKKWKLRPGDVYDGSYLEAFTAAEIRPRQQTGALPRTLRPQVQVDPDKLIVNVRFVTQ
jgi:outer membrane protein assembly factor BamA